MSEIKFIGYILLIGLVFALSLPPAVYYLHQYAEYWR
jgi:hypothetical protein